MKEKLVVGQFNDSFVPVMDGVTNVVKNYAYWLDKKYGECYVATPAYPGYVDREEFPVLRYYSIPLKKREPYRIGLELLDINFRTMIKSIPFDIVHAHCPFTSGVVALQIARKNNIPIVATFHSKFYDDFKQVLKIDAFAKFCTRIVMEFFDKVDQVWTVNKSTADTLREYGYKGDIEIVPNGTDFVMPENMDSLIEETENKLNLKKDDLVFLFVGQHIWQKNVKLLVDSLKILSDRNVDYKMFFVGDGYAKDELEAYVKELGLTNRITFLGKILDRDYLRSLFARADLFLFPSVYDNAPIVIREAAAVATPSLVIANSNTAEGIIDNVNGFLSENDAESYANRIISIIKDRDLLKKVGEKARETIYRDWESIVDEVYRRYLEIIRIHKKVNKIS
ncbi:glycosyl transferase group 1 [Thermoclostridium stercorarium subsp. stercorarium DSM 8532]|jgi:1,2-diacylglycerol 3-alpha-glucosyltransferase|uniref:Glycosyl transferase group 1 n=3 Tax=Thermoclostridium stercorarium TaxID=1510 RepID=L7VMT8_THES1|nr:glycosyltransferase [Thermoclostridium stercorarium]AGC67781.1 glycosyl transferase group 1 [Thermoclostridium stercorarium subsp. stercorarium DSM 8532]AGI38824.1 glycosyltransferase [Thermoclostridium stercorarium subsp. stercorarium DSM 8532]ANW98186.1 glycosyl transferase [Thermoclostridium stercorarium subsp. thermolacticum DSM 2910]ANX00727.1 glycosyl transferase [Thermoclostridium stercorarium subsp. leptospartum DSM 9219]UZQ86344.1 glycosyltransferase [Thermoclostridium stercorarium